MRSLPLLVALVLLALAAPARADVPPGPACARCAVGPARGGNLKGAAALAGLGALATLRLVRRRRAG